MIRHDASISLHVPPNHYTHHPDDVEVTGVVMRFFKEGKLKIGAMTDVPLFVHANNVVVVRHSDKGSIEVDEDSVQEFRHFWEHHQQHPLQVGSWGFVGMFAQYRLRAHWDTRCHYHYHHHLVLSYKSAYILSIIHITYTPQYRQGIKS